MTILKLLKSIPCVHDTVACVITIDLPPGVGCCAIAGVGAGPATAMTCLCAGSGNVTVPVRCSAEAVVAEPGGAGSATVTVPVRFRMLAWVGAAITPCTDAPGSVKVQERLRTGAAAATAVLALCNAWHGAGGATACPSLVVLARCSRMGGVGAALALANLCRGTTILQKAEQIRDIKNRRYKPPRPWRGQCLRCLQERYGPLCASVLLHANMASC